MASFAEKLANVVSRHDEISALLSSPDVGADDLVRMNKELAALTPVVEAIHEYNHAEKNMADAKAMMDDSSLDKEMREMAEAEFYELKEKLPEMSEEQQLKLLASDGMLVKRPVLVKEGLVLVGFRQKEWEEALLP